ncbi:MAG: HDOD domain-containing protein [Desulfomicrobium sp.]
MKAKILFIDDQENILQSLKLSLRNMRSEWDMSFAQSGQEGLSMFKQIWPDVVVTDMRMPNMDGGVVLKDIQKLKPDVGKIILSGYSDKETVFKNIQHANEYLSKPCKTSSLVEAINNTLKSNMMIENETIKYMVAEIETIPSSPEAHKKLINLLSKDDTTPEEIGTAISQDIALSTILMRVANCAFFNFPTQAQNITHAVKMMGQQTLLNITKASHLFENIGSLENPRFSINMLWEHSLRVAQFAKTIAIDAGLSESLHNDCFMAAMFHDIGKFILASRMEREFSEIITIVEEEQCPVNIAEQRVLGTTHADIGAYLLARWGFSYSQISIIRAHHDENVVTAATPTPQMILFIANCMDHELVRLRNRFNRNSFDFIMNSNIMIKSQIDSWRNLCSNEIHGAIQ